MYRFSSLLAQGYQDISTTRASLVRSAYQAVHWFNGLVRLPDLVKKVGTRLDEFVEHGHLERPRLPGAGQSRKRKIGFDGNIDEEAKAVNDNAGGAILAVIGVTHGTLV